MRNELLKNVHRMVVKFGTGILTNQKKQLDLAQMRQLVAQIAAQHAAGREVVIVSSGAVGAGMGTLGLTRRPTRLAQLQACAAIGQSRLMTTYEELFARHQIHVGQVLLTHADLQHHDRHLNARNTLLTLLKDRVIPIVNENDAVSFTELKFGDNDRLSALVASLLAADLLVILTSVDGVIQNFGASDSSTISTIREIDSLVEKTAAGPASSSGIGGMSAKITAAKITMRAGIPMIIASGRKRTVLRKIIAGKDEGTAFVPRAAKLAGRKRWLAFFHHPSGTILVDDGAKQALRENGRSLLLPGVRSCEGVISPGDVVRICDLDGTEFARGICRYAAADLTARNKTAPEVVHRDDLVLL